MRILLWCEYFLPIIGGIERHAANFVREMTARGHEFIVVTTQYDESLPQEELWHGIQIYRFSFAVALSKEDIPKWMREQKRLAQIIEDFDPQLCHIFGMGTSVLTLLRIYKQRPMPLLVRLATMITAPVRMFAPDGIFARTLSVASWVTSVSQAVFDQTVEYMPLIKSRISVLYNGHPTPTLEPTALAEPPRILFLGRLVEQKGLDIGITAFAELYKRYPDARLIVAGDGIERAPLEQLATSLGLLTESTAHAPVEFLGWCPPANVHALINSATLVLIPSRWEGLPNVAIEAAYMARPTVATTIPGMSEVIVDGETGLLVEPDDVQGLVEAMSYVLENPEQAKRMGMAAHTRAHTRFTMARCVEEYELLYPRVVAEYYAVTGGLTGA